jgi:hypothetical protein
VSAPSVSVTSTLKSGAAPGDLLCPATESLLRAPMKLPAGLDKTLANSFLRALAKLAPSPQSTLDIEKETQASNGWRLISFPQLHRPYRIPMRGEVALLAARSPDLTKEFIVGVKKLCGNQKITRLYIYDTRPSERVAALCRVLEPSLETLVIRDHHGEGEEEQARAAQLRDLYGRRAEIVLATKAESPTCFDLLAGKEGELVQGKGKALVITAPLDFDALACISRGFGLSYPGQRTDVLAIEAKDRAAQKIGVSPFGSLILDAHRVAPMVVRGRGSETFAALFQLAALQAIEGSTEFESCSKSPAGETLSMLAALAAGAKTIAIESLLKKNLVKDRVVSSGVALNICLVDLAGGRQPEEPGSEAPMRTRYESIGVSLSLSPEAVRAELSRQPERLRMNTLDDACSQLIQRRELPRNVVVFVRYPGEGERAPLLRVAAFGQYRHQPFLGHLPCELSKLGHGVITSQDEFDKWLGAAPIP